MKKQTLVRIIVCVLILAMLVPLVACTQPNGNNGETTTEPKEDEVTTTTGGNVTQVTDAPVIPDDVKYQDKVVRTLYWSDVEHNEFDIEAADGDDVNNALWTRNSNVEDRLGVELAWVGEKGNAKNIGTFKNKLKAIHDGTDSEEYHMFATYSLTAASASVDGYFKNLTGDDCEYLDFSREWWPKNLIKQITFGDNLYFASGDISLNTLYMMYVCYVNMTILSQHQLQNPQELVASGDWTYDKFFEMCENIYQAADGNSSGSKAVGDTFAYMTRTIHADPWFYGTGAVICEYNSQGKLTVSKSMKSDAVADTIKKLQHLFYETNDGIYTKDKVYHQKEFGNGRLLFMTDRARVSFKVLATIDNPNLDFVIVPCPKYAAGSKTSYSTVIGNPFTFYGILERCKDPTMASAVMEYYAYQNYKVVTPVVYERTLKGKYVNDPVSRQMYDIIKSNLVFDIGRMFSDQLGDCQSLFRNAIATDKAANWKKDVEGAAENTDKLCAKIQAILEKSGS